MNVQMFFFVVFAALTSAIGDADSAQVRTPTQIIEQGMLVLVKGNESVAVDTWINKGTTISTSQRQALVAALSRAKETIGPAEDFEIVRDGPISQRVRVLYVIVHHRSAPLFYRFYMYRLAGDEWAAIKIKADTDAQDVFPPELAYGRVPGG